jgi:hypothetical protein
VSKLVVDAGQLAHYLIFLRQNLAGGSVDLGKIDGRDKARENRNVRVVRGVQRKALRDFKAHDDGKSCTCRPLGPLQIWLGNRVNFPDSHFQMSGVNPGPEPRSFIGRESAERLQG